MPEGKLAPITEKIRSLKDRGFKYEVQHGLKIHETPDAGF